MTDLWLPTGPLLVQLKGLEALGLDAERLRSALGPIPNDPNAPVPTSTYLALWDVACQQYGRPSLPTALATAIPFGAFGVLDYLVGSAVTMGAGCESLALHFDIVANDIRFELESQDTCHWLRLRADSHVPDQATEFTLAMMVLRIRHLVAPGFRPELVFMTGSAPSDNALHQATFSCPVVYGAPVAGLAIAAADWSLPIRLADAYLHTTLKGLAAQLRLGQAATSGLEQAIQARLRDALPSGDASPARLARLIGLSERTLQRRLANVGRTFSAVVEDFRHEEALRLLSDPTLAVVHIAATLGFSEQTSFTRAFKRWTATTPAAWRESRRT